MKPCSARKKWKDAYRRARLGFALGSFGDLNRAIEVAVSPPRFNLTLDQKLFFFKYRKTLEELEASSEEISSRYQWPSTGAVNQSGA